MTDAGRVLSSGALATQRDRARIGRLPVRMRLTLSFAVVMVVLFGLIALLLYFTLRGRASTRRSTARCARAPPTW